MASTDFDYKRLLGRKIPTVMGARKEREIYKISKVLVFVI